MYKRIISLPNKQSFFLWGPRQTGKSSLLKALPNVKLYIDLLKNEELIQYKRDPSLLRQQLAKLKPKQNEWVILDEVQKVPELMDEIHHLIEDQKINFILAGSSARKLKKQGANLLGGRAWVRELRGLVYPEMGKNFNLTTVLNRGTLPKIYDSENYSEFLRSYVGTYLKEEILDEGLSRNLPAFSEFLNLASLSDTEVIAYDTFARDVGVSSPTIKSYFEILTDTLIGNYLNVYKKRPKRRLALTPKFYFFDVGLVNHLSKRKELEDGSDLWGKAFENYLHHELQSYKIYKKPDLDISFWRLSSQIEVDFILGDMEVAIEVKSSKKIREDQLSGLRNIKEDHPKVKRRIMVCCESRSRITLDGIEILNYHDFLSQLWNHKIIS